MNMQANHNKAGNASLQHSATPSASAASAAFAVVRLQDVQLRYGKVTALAGITLDLPAGCIIGMIGPMAWANPACSRS